MMDCIRSGFGYCLFSEHCVVLLSKALQVWEVLFWTSNDIIVQATASIKFYCHIVHYLAMHGCPQL